MAKDQLDYSGSRCSVLPDEELVSAKLDHQHPKIRPVCYGLKYCVALQSSPVSWPAAGWLAAPSWHTCRSRPSGCGLTTRIFCSPSVKSFARPAWRQLNSVLRCLVVWCSYGLPLQTSHQLSLHTICPHLLPLICILRPLTSSFVPFNKPPRCSLCLRPRKVFFLHPVSCSIFLYCCLKCFWKAGRVHVATSTGTSV